MFKKKSSEFLTTLKELGGFKFITATPKQVDYFEHNLDNISKNQEMAKWLKGQPSKNMHKTQYGDLLEFDTAVALIDYNDQMPIRFLYTFSKVNRGIVEEHIWRHGSISGFKINSKSLSSYVIFDLLVPKYETIISASEYTVAGERWYKKQIKEAILLDYNVYLTNEYGAMFEVVSYKEAKKRFDILFGKEEFFKDQRVIISKSKF